MLHTKIEALLVKCVFLYLKRLYLNGLLQCI